MDLGPRLILPASAVAAGGLLQAAAPYSEFIPDAPPYAWMAIAAYGGWQGKTAWTVLRDGRSRNQGDKLTKDRRRYQGNATTWELLSNVSVWAVRSRAKATRPTLDGRWTAPGPQVGVPLGRIANRRVSLVLRSGIWGTPEDTYLAIGPARSGKTGAIGTMVIDAVGAVITTSSRVDLYLNTARNRAAVGPVYVLNADDLANAKSTLRWCPLTGCETAEGAIERAGYLMAASAGAGGDDGAYWEGRATELLRQLLLAAALAKRSGRNADIRTVYQWAVTVDDPTPLKILRDHPDAPEGWAQELESFTTTTTPTHQASVIALVKAALSWLAHPVIREAALPEPGDEFNVEEFIRGRGTLYLIGADRPHSSASPFIAAFVSHIYEAAKRLASTMEGGRLDPPLTMALDEAAIVCPIPIDRWIVESGGWGITLIAGLQSIDQMHGRWGPHGAKTIWNNSTIKIIYGGFTDPGDLSDLSRMCGTVTITTPGGDQERALMPPEAIRLIPRGTALIVHRSTRPFQVKPRNMWDRDDFDPIRSGQDGPAAIAAGSTLREIMPGERDYVLAKR